MPTVGTDCHITLQHPDVNGGVAYGFFLDDQRERVVSVQRATDSNRNITSKCFFNVLLADSVRQPNGAISSLTKSAMYNMLILFLQETSGITLDCAAGVFGGLGALGHSATEVHGDDGKSVVACQLNNDDTFFPAADSSRYNASRWVDRDTYAGSMRWGRRSNTDADNSYWRNS